LGRLLLENSSLAASVIRAVGEALMIQAMSRSILAPGMFQPQIPSGIFERAFVHHERLD
jgi:hypothetical protein